MASSKEQVEKQTMKFKGTLIVVKDCSKALKYYRDMFGFELIRDNDGNMELSGNLYLQEENTGSGLTSVFLVNLFLYTLLHLYYLLIATVLP